MNSTRVIPLLLLAFPALAEVTVPADDAANAATTHEIKGVQATSASFKGKIIKINFLCRGNQITDLPDGGKSGEVLDSATTRQKLDVEVPKEGVDWFMQIPTTDAGGPTITAYGRLVSSKFGEPVFKILGTQMKSDAKGAHFSW